VIRQTRLGSVPAAEPHIAHSVGIVVSELLSPVSNQSDLWPLWGVSIRGTGCFSCSEWVKSLRTKPSQIINQSLPPLTVYLNISWRAFSCRYRLSEWLHQTAVSVMWCLKSFQPHEDGGATLIQSANEAVNDATSGSVLIRSSRSVQ